MVVLDDSEIGIYFFQKQYLFVWFISVDIRVNV